VGKEEKVKKITLLSIVVLLLLVSQTAAETKRFIWVETYMLRFNQTGVLPILDIPYWSDFKLDLNRTGYIDVGWNPTWQNQARTKSISLWLIAGNNFYTDSLKIKSWNYNIFLVQKTGRLMFD